MLKRPNEEYNLPIVPFGRAQSKRPDGWQKVAKIFSNSWHETRDVQVCKRKFDNVGQRLKRLAWKGTARELDSITVVTAPDLYIPDEGK